MNSSIASSSFAATQLLAAGRACDADLLRCHDRKQKLDVS
jgi:hypothetical protein